MRRCMIFFTLLIITVIIAVFAEQRPDIPKEVVIVAGADAGYDLLAAEEGLEP